jgi:bifunctional UDP-N-acetylglucosamine pyrophosphorylase/glucosamine-1-phosphate N-acetyltransferase
VKVVIIAAGKGTRMDPFTLSRPKPLIPVGGKPLIEHTITALNNCGITEIIVVIGYMKTQMLTYFEKISEQSFQGLKITSVEQKEQKGTAHALMFVEEFIDETFMLINGDIITSEKNIEEILNTYDRKNTPLFSLTQVEDPSNYGIVDLDTAGYIKKIVEKPAKENAPSNLANAGIYILPPQVFDAVKETPVSSRDEYELTDSIQNLIDNGFSFIGHILSQWWVDCGLPWDLLRINEQILKDSRLIIEGEVEEGARLKGHVGVGKNSIIRSGAYIQGPVLIGMDSEVGPNNYIRPYTYVGNDVRIGNAVEIKNSIILDHTRIGHLSYVGDSIIGDNCNFGAGTKIANLRLDNKTIKVTIQGKRVDSGRRKLGVFMGDTVKTGINASFMPGVKIGPNSAIGAEVLVSRDVPTNTLLQTQQDLKTAEWPLVELN